MDTVNRVGHINSMTMKADNGVGFFCRVVEQPHFMGFLMCCWFGVVQILQKTMIQVELVFKRGFFCPCFGSLSLALLFHYKSREFRGKE